MSDVSKYDFGILYLFLNHQKNKQNQIPHVEVAETFIIINDWVEVSITSLKHLIKV